MSLLAGLAICSTHATQPATTFISQGRGSQPEAALHHRPLLTMPEDVLFLVPQRKGENATDI